MRNGPGHGGSLIQRWLLRSSNTSQHASYGGSDTESSSTGTFSPPPLTDSSSTSASSGIETPKDPPAHLSRKFSPARSAVVSTPRTPPTRYAELPMAETLRKHAISLPSESQRPTVLALAQPHVKLHRLLSYNPMHRPLIYDVSSPPSYIRQTPQTSHRPNSMPSHALVPYSGPIPGRRMPYHFAPNPQPAPISDEDLRQLATTPPVTVMNIISDIIPWPIHVRGRHAVSDDRMSHVKVVDVLDTIYHSLRTGVNEHEWHSRPKSFRDHVKKAYFDRCARARAYTLDGYEEKQGVRRVDWLLERIMFLGLTIKTFEQRGEEKRNKVPGEGEITWVMMMGPR